MFSVIFASWLSLANVPVTNHIDISEICCVSNTQFIVRNGHKINKYDDTLNTWDEICDYTKESLHSGNNSVVLAYNDMTEKLYVCETYNNKISTFDLKERVKIETINVYIFNCV